MAYILGYFYADGSLEDASYLRGKYIRVTSIDQNTIRRIKRVLNSAHRISVLKPAWPNGNRRYFLRIGSHKLYDSLISRGLYPNKSLTIRFPNIPKRYLSDFLRGYFDGDGCVYLYRTKGLRGKLIIKKLSVIFTSGSKDFLIGLCECLRSRLLLDQTLVYNSTRSFQLRYSTGDSVKLFKFLYSNLYAKMFLPRKFQIFRKYFQLRPSRVDSRVALIFNRNR